MNQAQRILEPWQFRIACEPVATSIPFGGMYLEVGPGINVHPVQEETGVEVGYLIGFVVDLEQCNLLRNESPLKINSSAASYVDDFVDALFERIGGRFIFLLDNGIHHRIYPDVSAQVPCVYDPVLKIAGSTAHALLDDSEYERRFDRGLYKRFDVEKDGWLPGGLTAHTGIERLLPNHYLDLLSWEMRRHWPRSELQLNPDPHIAVNALSGLIRGQVQAIIDSPKNVAQGLTAGRETRALLASAQDLEKEMKFVTITGGGRYQKDTIGARKIASLHNLNFEELQLVHSNNTQKEKYLRRGGHCTGGGNAIAHPSVWPLAQDYVLLGGAGGEVGRAFFWRPSDTASMALNASDIAARMGLPLTRELQTRLEKWLANIPTKNALWILDLAYIEQRMGPWGGVQFYCDPTLIRISPLVNRQAISLLMQFPENWKRNHRVLEEIVNVFAPDLAKLPYNDLGFLSTILVKSSRVIDNPRLLLRKLLKKFG